MAGPGPAMTRQGSCDAPLHQRVRCRGVVMGFEYRLDGCSDHDLLVRVAKEIPQHANVARVRQFNEYGNIRAVVAQRRMYRMPTAGPGPDTAFALHRNPPHVP